MVEEKSPLELAPEPIATLRFPLAVALVPSARALTLLAVAA
jgi:hypothetical protein